MTKPPKFLFLTINEVCNLRCRHCLYWRSKKHPQVTLDRQLELVREFAELSPGGSVVICGGEPMLDDLAYFSVCKTSRQLNLRTLSVVNGTMIRDSLDAHYMVANGPDEISISLDHPRQAIHDFTRGKTGSYDTVANALSHLLRARDARPYPRIYVMGLLCWSTYALLDEFYDLVLNQFKADKLKLNAVQPTFLNTRGESGQEPEQDDFFARESQVNPDTLWKILRDCNLKYRLNLNPEWIVQMCSYFRALWKAPVTDLLAGWMCGINTPDHFCDSADRNIMVDLDGVASLCFSRAFRQEKLSKPGDMRRFWEESSDVREEMLTCNRICGISHSVRNSSATLKRK